MTTNDTRTDAERRYDAARLSPPPTDGHSPLYHELKAWIDTKFDASPTDDPTYHDPLRVAARAYDASPDDPAAYATLARVWNSRLAGQFAGRFVRFVLDLCDQGEAKRAEDLIVKVESTLAAAQYPRDYEQGRQDGAVVGTEADNDEEENDEDARVLFTDDSRPIRVERVGYGRDRAWLDFSIGARCPARALVSVDIVGGRPGLDLILRGCQVGSGSLDVPALTLADLRQIHADLTALLADDRLLGALAEQRAA